MIPTLSTNLANVTARYKVILVDNYGVLRTADNRFSKSYQALNQLMRQGKEVFLFSNTSHHTEADLKRELAKQGVELEEDHIITPGTALPLALAELGLENKPVHCLGPQATIDYVLRAGLRIVTSTEAEAVILGEHAQNCSEQGVRLFEELCFHQQKPALLLNTDRFVPVNQNWHVNGPGYAWLELAKSRPYNLIGLGKPHRYMYQVAQAKASRIPLSEILAVGDTLTTDILGAREAGIDSLLVLSGIDRVLYEHKIGSTSLGPTYIVAKFEF